MKARYTESAVRHEADPLVFPPPSPPVPLPQCDVQRCDHVSIQNNEVYNGGELATGIFLHRSSDYAIVRNNYIYNMQVRQPYSNLHGLNHCTSFHFLEHYVELQGTQEPSSLILL